MNYKDFLGAKKHSIGDFGFKVNYIPEIAFDFQKEIIERSVRKGRIAIFAATIMQLHRHSVSLYGCSDLNGLLMCRFF